MSDQTTSLTRQLVPVAKVLGITGSAALSGFIASFSYMAIPVLQKLPDEYVAKRWLESYKIGAATAPPVAVVCSICFGFLASQSTKLSGRYPQWSFDPTSPLALYTTAAIIIPSIAPYTLGIMLPTNNRLTEKADKTEAVSPGETQSLIEKWKAMNYNRAIMVAVGSVLGAVASLM